MKFYIKFPVDDLFIFLLRKKDGNFNKNSNQIAVHFSERNLSTNLNSLFVTQFASSMRYGETTTTKGKSHLKSNFQA